MRTSDGLLIVPADERQTFGRIERLVESTETGGRWAAVIVHATEGTSGRTHIHRDEPEAFFLLSGEVEICGAESITPIGPGDFVLVPDDVEHTIGVLSETASWLAIWPSKLDGILEEGAANPDADQDEIRRRHGMEAGRVLA